MLQRTLKYVGFNQVPTLHWFRGRKMYRRWTFKYSLAAVVTAIAIISISIFANLPYQSPQSGPIDQATLAVLLTDPPTVPAGTTQLNMTYTDFAIHVIYQNGTDEWLPVGASGTVNLFSLINVTQTIAATTIPINTTVDKVQFTIKNVTAVVNAQTYNVTSLSDTFVVKIEKGIVNQTLSGVLVDFNPTLVQIQAIDENDTTVYYYVLVPSANAMIVNDITFEHVKVGTIVQIGENNKVKIAKVKEDFSKNMTIVSATLTVKDNTTGLSVALKNEGNIAFRVFGLSLNGEFNIAQYLTNNGKSHQEDHGSKIHSETIPFKLTGTSLSPIYGNGNDDEEYRIPFSSVTVSPGETLTVTFNGIIALNTGGKHNQNSMSIITPIVDGSYTLKLMGEGFETFAVTAASLP